MVIKRWLDVAGALAGIVLFSPLFAVLAILIRLDSRGPILFRQPRIGRDDRVFEMLKFRTMVPGADEARGNGFADLSIQRETWRRFQKLVPDPRLTRVGRLLRRFSLDELPQLWNVLKGEMSLVGPRPILPDQRGEYGEALAQYVCLRPGMTGLWQVSGRNLLPFSQRARLDLCYIRGWSLRLDLQLLARTLRVVLEGRGAY